MLYKTLAIIIKTCNLGEYDRLITAYTQDHGKLLLRGKAVRKNQAKLRGHLELFCVNHIMVAPAKGFDIITNAETIHGLPYLHGNLEALKSAYYFSNLIDKLIPGPEKDEQIWQLLLESFQSLDRRIRESNSQRLGSPTPKDIEESFEKRLLQHLGYDYRQRNVKGYIESLINEPIQSLMF